MRIRIEKISAVETGLPANPRHLHVDGQAQDETYSLPLEYTIEGELVREILEGKSVVVVRDTRNGVQALGMFNTSPVTKVTEDQFYTQNSVYNYKFL